MEAGAALRRFILTTTLRYRLKPGVLNVTTGGEEVLMDYTSGKYFGLRGAAVKVVDSLREGAGLDDMLDTLSSEYEVSEAAAKDDLLAILQRLTDAGLVLVE